MATAAQILANQSNAQQSTGPRTAEGKAASAQNHRSHGFTARFSLLSCESPEEFAALLADVRAEHQPATFTEHAYVNQMAQSLWLRHRAVTLQTLCFNPDVPQVDDEKKFALYLRYQTTADRTFDRCVNQLLKLRNDKRKAEIGFDSQKRRQGQAAAAEARKQEAHEVRARLTNAKAEAAELDSDIRQTVEAPMPGHTRLSFDEVAATFRTVLHEVNEKMEAKLKAA